MFNEKLLTLIRFVLHEAAVKTPTMNDASRGDGMKGNQPNFGLLDRQRAALLKQVAPRAARAPQPTGFQHNIILLNAAVVKINRAFILLDRPSANSPLLGLRLPLRSHEQIAIRRLPLYCQMVPRLPRDQF